MAKILVTGGAGFIGSHVVAALLARGDEVTVLDDLSTGKRENISTNVPLVVESICSEPWVRELVAQHDSVIHLAAIASVQKCRDEWLASHHTNVGGTVALFEAAAKAPHKPPIIYASSAAVYGDNPNLPLSETATPAPLTSYGMDKWANERYAALAWQHYQVPSVGLRFFNVYGPRQDPTSPYSGVISKFAEAAHANAGITFFGDGEQTRDFIYVGDVVRLVLGALGKCTQEARVFNGCTGHATSLRQLAETLRTLTSAALPATHQPARAGDIRHSLGNPDAANQWLSHKASTSLAEGLGQLLAFSQLRV